VASALQHDVRTVDLAPGPASTNLPAQLTSFVGRGEELAEVRRLLDGDRMITLTGSGGSGKTRLAIQAAGSLADQWPDGAWWVDLGPVTDPSRVAELAAATMGVIVEPVGGPLRALTTHLQDRRLLVCLDNCEHLLDATAELADALLRACPEASVLATSREPLGVAGETVWRVPSMAEDEAVALFTDRASRVRPGFAVDASNADAVRTICRRLDGVPLAIELAAAWSRALAPAQVAAELDDRFRLLAGAARGVVPRHQTLAASVDWSYDLLDESDQRAFRHMAVFAGGFGLAAARAVCHDPGDETPFALRVRSLVDKSLVLVDESEGQARYRLLETIRQYAHDRLSDAGEVDDARDRHFAHFLDLAETAAPELEQADQDTWLATLEAEHDNLRAALDWGLDPARAERGRRLAAALSLLWLLHGHTHEGIGWLQRAIDLSSDDQTSLQAALLAGAAQLGATGGRFELTIKAAEEGLEIATAIGDDRYQGRCLDLMAYIQIYVDFDAACELCRRARRFGEAAGDAWGIDLSLMLEGLALTNGDRFDEARPILERAVERCTRRGDRMLAAFALASQIEGAQRIGELHRAERLAREAVRLAEPLGDYFTVGSMTSSLAWVMGLLGDVDGGLRLLAQLVRSVEGAGDGVDVPTMAVTLGQLHLWEGDLAGARTWLERAARYAEPLDNLIGVRAMPGLAAAHRRRGQPDAARAWLDRAMDRSRDLIPPRVLAEVLDESARLLDFDELERAERLHYDALAIRTRLGLRTFYVDSLDALAHHAARVESFADAARLYAASDAARQDMGYPRPPVVRADHDAVVGALRAALGATGFEAAWAEGTSLPLDEAVDYVSRTRGTRGRPSAGWASLTPTEHRVIDLTVAGLTNEQIGARLFVSRNTVKTHLSHIYAKLGITNRTELATLVTTRAARSD
jgi:predicted ATPase/DNA-binding CsgD family transcriptional regulator